MKTLALLLCLVSTARAAESPDYDWDESWPRFRTSEHVVIGLAAAGAAANYYLVPPPRTPAWRGPILFDKGARNTLMIRSEAGRDRAKNLSDYLAFPLIGYSMLDGPVTAGWVGGNKDTAIQLALINAETFAVVEVLNLTVSNAFPRRRPEGATCGLDTRYDPHCVKSFWSGHTANVFAAAALVCSEHEALRLYGGKADPVACGASLAVASAVGVVRISGNDHHASDVIVGAAVGAAAGYLMPKLLHFRDRKSRDRFGWLVPNAGPQGGGLTYVRAW